jgi:hypothetical protein
MRLRPRILPLLASILMLAAGPTSAGADAEPREFTLALGDAVFWSGPGTAAGDCGSSCWRYQLHVTEPAYRLRVGIDRPLLGDVWRVELVDPSGGTVGSSSPGTDLYSAEVLDWGATAGTYEVRVTAQDVTDRRFRMRAALEKDNGGLPAGHVLTLPDLQPLPPWDFSFKQPITNGMLGGDSTGVLVPGGKPSCHPEEIQQDETIRCLRMSYGVGNVGLGPLELQVDSGGQFADRPLIQRVRYADGGAVSRSAGNAYYHHSHAHYHHDKAIGLQLLRVVDSASGILQPAADPHLKGFAHRDELLRGWTDFAPVWGKQGFGLLPGWADYYEWDRPGNYIDFGNNPNGLYVVRIIADPEGFIQETDPTDNIAYSLIRVSGTEVTHLQSGLGTDPWDRCRIPLPLGPEWQDSFELTEERPDDCPGEQPDPDAPPSE